LLLIFIVVWRDLVEILFAFYYFNSGK